MLHEIDAQGTLGAPHTLDTADTLVYEFRQVLGIDIFTLGEVGNGSGYFENAVIGLFQGL